MVAGIHADHHDGVAARTEAVASRIGGARPRRVRVHACVGVGADDEEVLSLRVSSRERGWSAALPDDGGAPTRDGASTAHAGAPTAVPLGLDGHDAADQRGRTHDRSAESQRRTASPTGADPPVDIGPRHTVGRLFGKTNEEHLEFVDRVVHRRISFSCCRPRCSDDLTVPSETPIASAISAVVICR